MIIHEFRTEATIICVGTWLTVMAVLAIIALIQARGRR